MLVVDSLATTGMWAEAEIGWAVKPKDKSSPACAVTQCLTCLTLSNSAAEKLQMENRYHLQVLMRPAAHLIGKVFGFSVISLFLAPCRRDDIHSSTGGTAVCVYCTSSISGARLNSEFLAVDVCATV